MTAPRHQVLLVYPSAFSARRLLQVASLYRKAQGVSVVDQCLIQLPLCERRSSRGLFSKPGRHG